MKVLVVFGTRPEVIKLAPVVRALREHKDAFRVLCVASGQHRDLLVKDQEFFGLRFDRDLHAMHPDQSPSALLARVLEAFDPVLELEAPEIVLVQGDTTTALAGAIAAFHRGVAVGHVEAGLRSGDPLSPFPEEMNRRLITGIATLHFAPTPENRNTLLGEGVPADRIFVTGNPIVDALQMALDEDRDTTEVTSLLDGAAGKRIVTLTTHRRESFGETLRANLGVLRAFIEDHEDLALVFPLHPNPSVQQAASEVLAGVPRVLIVDPLPYRDFVRLLRRSWLIVSDSGGIQEEAPTLGKPVLLLRETTERPEAIAAGVVRLVGGTPERLRLMLEDAYAPGSWTERVRPLPNPYGEGRSGEAIARVLLEWRHPLARPTP